MSLRVTLPDGSPLELADGATVRDAAAAIGPRLAKAAIGGRVAAAGASAKAARPATAQRAALVDVSHGSTTATSSPSSPLKADDPTPLDTAPPLGRARDGAGRSAALAGHQVLHRPDHRERLLLRLPARPSRSPTPTSRASRRRWRRSSQQDLGVAALRAAASTRRSPCSGVGPAAKRPAGSPARPAPRPRPALQGRAHRGPGRGRRGRGEPVPTISVYTQGEFTDLCRGPHLPSTGKLGKGTFKLTSVAGAYWRGDENNADAHPHLRHRVRHQGGAGGASRGTRDGPPARPPSPRPRPRPVQLPRGGPRLPLLPSQGHARLERDDRLLARRARAAPATRSCARRRSCAASSGSARGHWDNYKENMYFTEIDGAALRGQADELPRRPARSTSRAGAATATCRMRWAELGQVHRHEMSGVLHGLFRVRYFTQDDAHIYCTPEQLEDEVRGVLRFMLHIYAAFGFERRAHRALDPAREVRSAPTRCGRRAEARPAQRARERAASTTSSTPATAPSTAPRSTSTSATSWAAAGSAAPSRPTSPCPRRSTSRYTGADNEEHRPVMIHRALLGSIERFMGILIEHYGGALPTWLAPTQVLVLPIADRHADYAHAVRAAFRAAAAQASSPSGSRSTTARSRSASASATPSCRRCPTCSWSATARRKRDA